MNAVEIIEVDYGERTETGMNPHRTPNKYHLSRNETAHAGRVQLRDNGTPGRYRIFRVRSRD